MARWKRICCAVDLADPPYAALAHASELAARLEAELTLLYVNEATSSTGETGVAPLELVERTTSELQPRLRRCAEQITGQRVEARIVAGDAACEIVRFARAHAIDLLVMGSGARVGLRRLLRGSVTAAVVERASCPVVLVAQPPAPVAHAIA